jgi:tagatose-1,6-bisphosphate aldolase
MKAGIFYTGSGPILLLTSYNSLTDPKLIKKLGTKGIKKFVTYEVSEDLVREKYGNHYHVIMEDLHQEDDLRVLDYDGHHIYNIFSFKDLGKPIYYEP